MRKAFWGMLVFLIAGLIWLVSCTTTAKTGEPASKTGGAARKIEAPSSGKAVGKVELAKKAPRVKEVPPEKALFEGEIKPLSPVECARCHYPIYRILKDQGGKHRQVCTNCHEVYHRYNPLKNNWKAIMPRCDKCHGLPHGEAARECLSCHQEPHSPRRIELASVSGKCVSCHQRPSETLQTHESAHQEVGCEGCHSERHGRVPKCFECHDEGHVPDQTVEECLMCHNPHMPRDIKVFEGLEVDNRVCGACHKIELDRLASTTTKHGKQTCIFCHNRHGFKPKCVGCHGKPHSEALHRKFPQCLKCHLDPHSLRRPRLTEAPAQGK